MSAPRTAAADGAPASKASSGRVVQIDGLVLLKIIQHASQHFPEYVAGSLLGLDVDHTVEVTHSFAYPQEPGSAAEEGAFEVDMMKALRDVKVDNNAVGWYQCTYLGSYCTKDTIAHQAGFQEAIPNSVLVVYDGVRTSLGQLSVKAVRLTDAFMAAYRKGRIGMEAIATLSASQIFEELPLRIRNPHLIQAALFDVTARGALTTKALGAGGAGALSASAAAAAAAAAAAPASGAASSAAGTGAPVPSAVVAAGASAAAPAGTAAAGTGAESDFTRLDLNSGPFLEKHLELLKDVTEQLLRAQSETAAYQRRLESHVRQREQWLARRREENELRRRSGEPLLPEEDLTLPFFRPLEPPRGSKDPLDVLLMSANISAYCGQVGRFAGASFGKLFLASSLHK